MMIRHTMGVLVSLISLKFDDHRENQRNKLKKNKELSGNNISKKNELMGESFFVFYIFKLIFRLEIQKVPLKGRGIFSTRSFHKVSSVIFDF